MKTINLFPHTEFPSNLKTDQKLRFIQDQLRSDGKYNHFFELLNE